MQIQQLTSPAGIVTLAALPPLSLYVHIPWCVRKCPYCDFNSHETKGEIPEREYVASLIADLELALPHVWGRPVRTVFFGGGTPSLLSARALDELLSAIRARLPLAPDAEITLEANPGTFEAQKFADFRAAGVNRLSIGIQSFNPAHLKALGRIHDGAQARAAIEIAQASFDNFNLDLMYALPGQTAEQVLADIETAIGFGPRHVSAYHLTIEPNTYFYRHPPQVPDQDVAADMQEAIEARLASAGYRHYETSAFARPGREARHNLNYWTFGDYLGIGAGAHSKLSFADRILRQMRVKHPRDYLEKMAAGVPVQQEQRLAAEELPFEFMMNALRLIDGFELRLFAERTGVPVHALCKPLETAERSGLIERDHVRVRPTLRGQRFLNDLLQIFLGDSGTT
jgi:oxygen-independent coproporphyrinogen-3 oxidase